MIAGAEDVIGAKMNPGLDPGEERAEERLLRAQDPQRLEQERALAVDANDGLFAVFTALHHLDLGGLGVGHEEVGDGEELGEAVAPLVVLVADAGPADVDVDDAAAEDARPRRVLRAEDVDANLVVLEEKIAEIGHGHGAADELGAILDDLGAEQIAAVGAAREAGRDAEPGEQRRGEEGRAEQSSAVTHRCCSSLKG